MTCNSDLSWMFELRDLAKDSNLKKSMSNVTCFLVDQGKNVKTATNDTTNNTTAMNETNMVIFLFKSKLNWNKIKHLIYQ